MSRSALVFCGGDAPSAATLARAGKHDIVIAADSGIDHTLAHGIVPDIAVGDFDSVTPDGLAVAEAGGTSIERHPAEKDQTDFELALARAVAESVDQILVVSIEGGRLDHQLANLLALAGPSLNNIEVRALTENETITVVRSVSRIEGTLGDYLSLVPIGGDVEGVTTTGLAYPLSDESLSATSARGISNRFMEPQATVSVRTGVLLAIGQRG